MERVFLTVLNMSLTASFVIAVVMLARIILRRAPKIISYALWAVVLFNLLSPFKPESMFSLIPFRSQPISEMTLVTDADISFGEAAFYSMDFPDEDRLIPLNMDRIDTSVNAYGEGVTHRYLFGHQAYVKLGSYLWPVGMAALLLYAIIGYIRLKRRVSLAVRVENNIFETDRIDSPFVLGIISPRIYLPAGMEPNLNAHIIEHERTHIRRRDYIVSVIAFLALALHWFNPLVWIAYMLMLRDMESSCDEAVLRKSGGDIRLEYSSALLGFSHNKRRLSFPLAFGEQSVKERIKNVLNFKKPSRIIVVAALVVVIVLSVGFSLNRASNAINTSDWANYIFPIENYDRVFFECNDSPYHPEYNVISAQLMNNQNVQGYYRCGTSFTLVMREGSLWKIVPFADGVGFGDLAHFLESGSSIGYDIRPERLAVKLGEGQYRIVTDIYHHEIEGETPLMYTVWADFTIDRNAPKQEVHTVPAHWFGNPDGKIISLDDLREIAGKIPDLTVDDLFVYRYVNVSSGMGNYNLLFSTEVGSLQVYADSDYVISRMTFKIQESDTPLDLLAEPERLDDYLNGIYSPLTVADIIERNLDILGATVPAISSIHPSVLYRRYEEYQEIIALGNDALDYMFSLFEKGGQTGYRGGIMAYACCDILGIEYEYDPEIDNGQKWYDAYKQSISTVVDSNILSQIYLGMSNEEVYALFGEPDYQASGLMWYGYNDIGTFDPSFSSTGVVEGISLNYGTFWSVHELVRAAVMRHYGRDPSGEFPAVWYEIVSMDANEREFTVTGRAQYELYIPDGEYDVRRVRWERAYIEMTFAKNANYDYVLTSSSIEDGIWTLAFPPDLMCYDQAMLHFVGAIPGNVMAFAIGAGAEGIVTVTDIAAGEPRVGNADFWITYFPGATFKIEPYDENLHFSSNEPGSWVVEYADTGKNITVGREGTNALPITDDLIGIYDLNGGRYSMRFERYVRTD